MWENSIKTKYNFLKKVQFLTNDDIMKIKKLYSQDNFGYNTITSVGAHRSNQNELDESFRLVNGDILYPLYKYWYDKTKKGLLSKYKVLTTTPAYKNFFSDEMFNPNNLSYNTNFVKLCDSMYEKHPTFSKNWYGGYVPFLVQDDTFIHVRTGDLFFSKTNEDDKIECRLYINAMQKNIPMLVDKLLNTADFPLYFKFCLHDHRNETLLLYSNYENAHKLVEVLEWIRSTNPELFEGCEQISPFLGKINGYIGFAEEPNHDLQDKRYSFNGLRAKVFAELKDMKDDANIKSTITNIFGKYDIPHNVRFIMMNNSSLEELSSNGCDVNGLLDKDNCM